MNTIEYKGPMITNTIEELKNNKTLISSIRAKAIMQRIQIETLENIQEANLKLRDVLASYL